MVSPAVLGNYAFETQGLHLMRGMVDFRCQVQAKLCEFGVPVDVPS
jgi:hypothetical protein